MKTYLVCVSHKQPDWVEAGFAEYQKRLPKELSLNLIELKPSAQGLPSDQMKIKESGRILEAFSKLTKPPEIWALDEGGDLWSTATLAQELQQAQQRAVDIAWVIGGADGLSVDIKQKASRLISLSKLTLPHGLVKVMLAEQIYRAHTILIAHPYHRS